MSARRNTEHTKAYAMTTADFLADMAARFATAPPATAADQVVVHVSPAELIRLLALCPATAHPAAHQHLLGLLALCAGGDN